LPQGYFTVSIRFLLPPSTQSKGGTVSNYPDDADGAVLADLESMGVDMTQPLLFEFPVDAPDEDTANEIHRIMTGAGYDSHIEYDEGELEGDEEDELDDEELGAAWTVFANVRMVPNYQEILRIQKELDQLVEPLGGTADGWGVMIDQDSDDE
jgi:hypothetical protein